MFSLSKLQSFFWKISLNSGLIRLEGFNNKISKVLLMCSTCPSGKALALFVVGPEFDSGHNLLPYASLLFFSFFFFFSFSFSFHFRYNSFVMFLYIAYNFLIYQFSRLYLPFTRSPSRGAAIYVFLVNHGLIKHQSMLYQSSPCIANPCFIICE